MLKQVDAAAQLLLARALHPAADDRTVVRRRSCRRATNSSTAWRARSGGRSIGTDEAIELTHADGAYDYQPDVAPDGHSVVFARYDGKALRALAARPRERRGACADGERRRQSRAAHLAGRPPDRLRLDRGHRPLQPEDRRPHARGPRERALPRRAAREQDRPLLLFDARSRRSIRPGRRTAQRVFFVTNAEIPWGTGWICSVAVAGGEPECLTQAPARDLLGRAAGGRAGRQAHPVLELPRRAVAPALAHDDGRRRAAAAHLRRVRPPQRALVARRQAHRLHQQRGRQHRRSGCRRSSAARASRSSRSGCSPRHAPGASSRIRPMDAPGSAISARVSVLGSDGRWHAPARCLDARRRTATTARSSRAKCTTSTARPKSRLQRRASRRARRRSRCRAAFAARPSIIEREFAGRRDDRSSPIRLADNDLPRGLRHASSAPTCTCT